MCILAFYFHQEGFLFTVLYTMWQSVGRAARLVRGTLNHLRQMLNVTLVIVATRRTTMIYVMVSTTELILIVTDSTYYTYRRHYKV